MLVENQKIEMTWTNSNKKYYIDKGYIFTKIRDKLIVKVEDLTDGSHKNVKVICDFCNRDYTLEYRDYLKNTKRNNGKFRCLHCSNRSHVKTNNHITTKNRLKIEEVIKRVEQKNENKLLNPEEYINYQTANLRILCGSCGNEFTTSLASIDNSYGACLKCSHKKTAKLLRLSQKEVKYRIDAVNNNVLLNPEDYKDNHTSNLKIKCGDCGNTYITTLANYEYNQKIRCDKCSQRISVAERKVMEVFDRFAISYDYNHNFDDCRGKYKPLPFDFYLEDMATIIETDGQHHYRPIWGIEHFTRTNEYDKIKNEYCSKNNIRLIRIPFWDFDNIEQILIKELNLTQQEKFIA